MKTHFLQSEAWSIFQKSEGKTVFSHREKDFHYSALLETTPLGNYLFLPYGPSLKDEKSLKSALESLKTLAKAQNAFFVRIEPTFPLTSPLKNLKKTKNIDPEYTQIIDLTQPEDEILKNISKEPRRLYRIRDRKGLTIKNTKNPEKIDIFYNLYKKVAKSRNFHPHSKNYLKNQLKQPFATLYYAEYDDKIVSACICYDDKETRFYAHAASDYNFRQIGANSSLIIQIMLDAKKSGQKNFDLWGISLSNDPTDPWYGFTKFKQSFGGHPIEYAGTHDLILNPAKYSLYLALRKLNRLKRKLLS